MKNKILFIFTLYVLNAGISVAQSHLTLDKTPKYAGPRAKWVMNNHDFGIIPQGKPVIVSFKFTNTGASPLIISEVKTTCGCTTPFYTQEPVMPGRVGQVKVKYNAEFAGTFHKVITVKTNAEEVKKLIIKGIVKVSD